MNKEKMVWSSKTDSILAPIEAKFKDRLVQKVPSWISTKQLTWCSALWSILVLFFGYLAKNNLNWLWLVSLFGIFHYITDFLDGSVGRFRNDGLVRWGYYVDHLLDYFFLCSILTVYYMILPKEHNTIMLFIIIFFIASMVNSFIAFAMTDKFRYNYLGIGPIEFQVLFLIINISLIFFGTSFLIKSLPYILVLCILSISFMVYVTQKELYHQDMKYKDIKKKK
jgi:phosphatidylglycerophosphate synthase